MVLRFSHWHLTCLLLVLLVFNSLQAQKKTFIREYTYRASETDSKVSSRQKALTEVKSLLIEELGTYVESYISYSKTDENGIITKDFFTNEIKTLSTGTTETKIIEERWDGYDYFIKAEIIADPEEVVRRINETLSIRKSSQAVDSLKNLLQHSSNELTLKNSELDLVKKQLRVQQSKIDSTQTSLKVLNQQLIESKKQLSIFQAEEKGILTEIEAIEQKLKSATNKALTNVRIGMTHEEVNRVCGYARSVDCGNLNYGTAWVIFYGGIVTGIVDARDYICGYNMDFYIRSGKRVLLK